MTSPDTFDEAARLRLALVRLTRTLRRSGTSKFSASQVSALATIEEYGPLRISALAAHAAMDPSVATRVVASLTTAQVLQRAEDPDDRRACLVELSPQGREALAELWRERTLGLSERLERLEVSERQLIAAALSVIEKLAR